MKWILLSLGILFEIIALVFMDKSEGFTKLTPILFVFLFYSLALGCLILVLKRRDTSVEYAIWASGGHGNHLKSINIFEGAIDP